MSKIPDITILFIGDIVARPGRQAVKEILPQLKKDQAIDLVIANAENLSGGRGVTSENLNEMLEAGVDYFTSGNHVFHQPDWEGILRDPSYGLVRPVNYYGKIPGAGFREINIKDRKVVILNIQGTSSMNTPVENPFFKMDELFQQNNWGDAIVVVDFHAEVTSEKKAFGYYLDGRASVVFGTHTHVPTADLQTLPQGTLFISDVGMVGLRDSILGVDAASVIKRFTESTPVRFEWPHQGKKVFNSILFKLDSDKKITFFERFDRIIP